MIIIFILFATGFTVGAVLGALIKMLDRRR
jgi:hypothetical protein